MPEGLSADKATEHHLAEWVSFALPGDRQPVAVTGRVVRVHESSLCPGMAIRFVQMPEVAKRRLSEFMRNRSRTLANR